MRKKIISIVCPVYNEQETIERHYNELKNVTDTLPSYNFEFIYTDNASTDNTFSVLKRIAAMDKRIRVYSFSRNFGYQNSIYTAYQKSLGDAAINFDADLQDPPELLSQFLEKWEMGFKVIYGVRKKRRENIIITSLRRLFYRLINRLSETALPVDVGDFMLIDRRILDILKTSDERTIYLRGLIFSYGFPKIGIDYTRNQRHAGYSKFKVSNLVQLAIDGIVNQSSKPLQYLFYFGMGASLVVFTLLVLYFIVKFLNLVPFAQGAPTIIIFVLLSITLNMMFLGMQGLYISRIYTEIKKRPITIIEKKIIQSEVLDNDNYSNPH